MAENLLIIKKGVACKAIIKNDTLLGRILERINLSLVEFSTPHGSKHRVRVSLLSAISEIEIEELTRLEGDASKNKRKELIKGNFYGGQLKKRQIIT